jgi:Fe-S-cluster containining protein
MTIKNMRDPDLFDSKLKHKQINIVRRGEPIDLEELERQGESFKCLQGCNLCCEPLNFHPNFWEKYKHLALGVDEIYEVDGLILPIREGSNKCVFLDGDKGCVVYEDRPIICRIFGLDSGIECPYYDCHGDLRKRDDRRFRVKEFRKGIRETMYKRVMNNKMDANLIWKRS